jgi:hypothetical protein
VQTPQASPKATINQVVGLTDVEVVYSRPSARGRAVFLVLGSFDKLGEQVLMKHNRFF